MSLNKFTNFDRSSQASMNIQADSLKTEAFLFKPNGGSLTGKVLEIENEEGNVIAVDSEFSRETYSQGTSPTTYTITGSTSTYTRFTPDIQIPFRNFTNTTIVKIDFMGDYQTNEVSPRYEPVKLVLSGPTGDLWDYTYVVNPANNAGGMELPCTNTSASTQRSAFRHEIYLIFTGFGGDDSFTTYGQMTFYGTCSNVTPTDIPKRYTAISNLPIINHSNVLNLLPSDGVKFRLDTINSGTNSISFSTHLYSDKILLNSA